MQQDMAKQFETMMKQFSGFQNMMQNSLDSLNAMGSWLMSADKAFGDLRQSVEGTATSLEAISKWVDLVVSHVDSLEMRLTMAPAPISMAQATPGPKIVDLNLALGSSSCGPARGEEQPTGPDEHCGGVLRPRPQDILKGMCHNPPPVLIPPDDVLHPSSPPFPIMDFPKFVGEFPCLWRDQCEVYFEVYVVHPALKTRFATLNFKGAAATWL